MKINKKMIDKQLKAKGFLYSKLTILYNEKLLRKLATSKIKLPTRINKDIISEELYITTRNKNKLRICIYKPANVKPNATGLLWIHGGGYFIGSPEQDMKFYENFIKTENCVIVSPDYTLSVVKPYPAAFQDCYETLYWMKENAKKLGINSNQLFIGGDSAGGGLSIATTLYARDKKEVNIAFQMPLYPMIDDRMNTVSAIENNAPVWNSKCNYLGWKLYLGELFKTKNVPKYAAPARETDYSNLPPAFTFVGDLEPFYDETKTYINNLKKAGIKAELKEFKGCYHGFDIICPNAQCSKEATQYLLKAFRYAARNYFKEQNQ